METITVGRLEEIFGEVEKRHAEEVENWKETYAENANSLINNVHIVKSEGIMMSVEKNLIIP